jgi:hypothetical protein
MSMAVTMIFFKGVLRGFLRFGCSSCDAFVRERAQVGE